MWFAQAVTPDISAIAGGAGWAGAGLLGLVLGWLMLWHLPAKDRQIHLLIEGKDSIIREIITRNGETLRSVTEQNNIALDKSRDDFKEWLALISTNHNNNVKAITEAMTRELMSLASVVSALRDAIKELSK